MSDHLSFGRLPRWRGFVILWRSRVYETPVFAYDTPDLAAVVFLACWTLFIMLLLVLSLAAFLFFVSGLAAVVFFSCLAGRTLFIMSLLVFGLAALRLHPGIAVSQPHGHSSLLVLASRPFRLASSYLELRPFRLLSFGLAASPCCETRKTTITRPDRSGRSRDLTRATE